MRTVFSNAFWRVFLVAAVFGPTTYRFAMADSPALTASAPEIDDELRRVLLHMEQIDQDARRAVGHDPEALKKINQEIDIPNTERMKKIIAAYGWPGKSLVGRDGASAAWLLVQHATHDAKFMEQCLAMMQVSAERGEASRNDLALLIDRVRVRQGKPQLYGTQFRSGPDGLLAPDPIEDEVHLDERRKTMGLSTMAEYVRMIRQVYPKPVDPQLNSALSK